MSKKIVYAAVSSSLERKYVTGHSPLRYSYDWRYAMKLVANEHDKYAGAFDTPIGYLIPLEDDNESPDATRV
jgi:hypothetical protein